MGHIDPFFHACTTFPKRTLGQLIRASSTTTASCGFAANPQNRQGRILAVWILAANGETPKFRFEFCCEFYGGFLSSCFCQGKRPEKNTKNPPQNSSGTLVEKILLGFLQKPFLDKFVRLRCSCGRQGEKLGDLRMRKVPFLWVGLLCCSKSLTSFSLKHFFTATLCSKMSAPQPLGLLANAAVICFGLTETASVVTLFFFQVQPTPGIHPPPPPSDMTIIGNCGQWRTSSLSPHLDFPDLLVAVAGFATDMAPLSHSKDIDVS